ncbi:hypothetical protein EUGRSUZ_G01896 [Eucalyptus grandis]|uniref:Uncharacterized protein n=2 Tax=Eucalyptus grandis TaxID=71139 RepID=A0ACC3K4I2_EUCGR|nr:hypothetical protein EUGRSUZ_G01896 [Eucalyptus grandis]
MRSLKDGLAYQARAVKSGFVPSTFLFNQLIRLYSQNGLLREAHKLFDEMPQRNVYSSNALISAYVKARDLTRARALFDSATERDLVTYNSMLTGYVTVEGRESDALEWFDEMQSMRDRLKFDEFTLTAMLNLVAKLRVQCYGTQLHAYMVRTGNDTDKYVMSSLIDMYSKCGSFREAYRVFCESKVEVDLVSKNTIMAACCREGKMEVALDLFQRLPKLNDTVSWNTLISGYAQNGFEEESLNFFMKMRDSGFGWNEHTFASVLNACSSMRNSKLGKEIHAWVLREGVISNLFVKSALVDVYCKCGNIKYADLVYATIECENSFSTTSMIVGHSSQGNMSEARRLFDSLNEKNSIVWTALFTGYVKAQQCEAVFELLNEYRGNANISFDVPIIICLLGACALQAALDPGKQIHAYSLRKGMEMEEKLISATIDMYFKSGSTEYAGKIFQKLTGRDLILYNIMISGYANHGHEDQAMELYKEMLERGLKPDEVTFIALLSACRHSGLVEMGEKYFKSMVEDYKIVPEMDHYACMIDLYGRANRLEKAMGLMKKIPRNSDPVILGAFLNACKINRNLSLAREAAEQLLVIEEDNGSRYVQLANVFAAEENWAEMRKIREKMRGKETKKLAGCSWVYLENGIHAFTSGDTSHIKAEAIYSILEFLSADLRVLPNSSVGKITTLTLT